jgi:hypothetical protein
MARRFLRSCDKHRGGFEQGTNGRIEQQLGLAQHGFKIADNARHLAGRYFDSDQGGEKTDLILGYRY